MADITLTVDVSSLGNANKRLDEAKDKLDALKAAARENSSIVGLSRGINTLQNNIRELVTAQQKGTIGSSAYQLGLLQVKRAYEQMGLTSQAATSAVRRYAAELQRQDAARIAEKAANDLAIANQRATQSYNQLRASMDPVFAAQMRMKQAHDTVRAALAAGIITRAQAAQSLLQYRAALRAATAAAQQHSLGLNKTAVLTQQAGYQIGDFFVQVQSGTNFLVAFGQQATQIVGTMAALATTTKMIAIFSGLGVLIAIGTAIGAYFMRASGASDTLATKLTKLTDISSKLRDNFRFLKQDDLGETFGNMTGDVVALTEAMLELNAAAEMRKLKSFIDGLDEAVEPGFLKKVAANSLAAIPGMGQIFADNATKNLTVSAYESLGLTMARSQFDAYQGELMLLANTGDKEGVTKAIKRMVESARGADGSFGAVTEGGFNLLTQLSETALAIAQSVALQNGSADAAARLADEVERQREAEKQKLEYIKESALQYYQNLQDQKTLNDERKSAVDALISSRDEELQKLSQEKELLQKINAFGKDSAEVKAYEADIARQNYAQELLRQGILGNNFKLVMEEYDALVLVKDQLKESEKITKLLEQGLSLSVIEAMNLAGVDFTKLSKAALDAGVMATNLGISFGLASEIGKISAMSESDRKIYTGVKSGLLPEAALNSIGLGPTGFTREGSFPINMPGMMPDNPTTASTGTEGGTGTSEATQTAIERLQEQLAVERELIGTSEAYQKVRQALGEEFKTTSPEVIAGLVEQATQVERLIDLEKQREQVLGTVKASMEDTLMSIVDGTKSARDAFKAMAADIIKELYRVYVVQQLVNSVSGFIMPSKGAAGSVPRLSQAQPRAAGGSMMANMAYMVGENGPELVIPRHSGTVVNAKQTASAVGGGGNFTQNLSINVTGSDAAMVRTEVAKMIPQITNATKAAVLDAKQRGGQFAAAFR